MADHANDTLDTPSPSIGFDEQSAVDEFRRLKQQGQGRNNNYYLLRQAVKGRFRWPRNWPAHIEKLKHNLLKPITERFATFMMGKEFTFNVDRPNSLEFRDSAEKTEKILERLMDLSRSGVQFEMGAKTGTQLGRTIFRIYRHGKPGAEYAKFSFCQPDYFYGIPASDDALGEWSTVYYSYPLDIDEAKRIYGPKPFKTEAEVNNQARYDTLPERQSAEDWQSAKSRRIPVLEAWTKDSYMLQVGGITLFNGANPYVWSDSGEGFIPFVVIENVRNSGDGIGESDIEQARELNEFYNYLLSRKHHMVSRWLTPTIVWEGGPQNYASILASVLTNGGAVRTRLGSRLSLLAHDRANPSVTELEATLRQAILETSGMSELALQGTTSGSINTGPALAAQYQPVLATVDKKRTSWEDGLIFLFSAMLQIQEDIGDSKVLGMAVVGSQEKSENSLPVSQEDADAGKESLGGVLVPLSGSDINGLRKVTINWPGVLPKDSEATSRLEMEKVERGLQSVYTTLEKLGVKFPDDEIARIRAENEDPSLKGALVAEQVKAQASQTGAEAQLLNASPDEQQQQLPPLDGEEGQQSGDLPPQEDGAGGLLRALANRGEKDVPTFNTDEDEPVIDNIPPPSAQTF